MSHHIDRRTLLKVVAGASSALTLSSLGRADTAAPAKSALGLVVYCSRIRRDALRRRDADCDLYEPRAYLEHCHSLGAGGMQCSLGVMQRQEVSSLRAYAEQHGLYIEAIVRLPKDASDADRFSAEMKTAADTGALAARTTIIPGRRYEYFDSFKMFKKFEALGRKALERGAPIAEKHRVPLAIENHKDQRNDERLALLKLISSQFVGACVDTGNSFALLEDPIETVEAFAPWAHSIHLKDQSLQLTEDGFLLADVPLGEGSLDLKRMVKILKKAKPAVRHSLELITRDPLRVPCLEGNYWRTFPQLPASALARTLRYVRDHTSDSAQYISKMTPDERLAREDANVRQSLDYARDELF